MTEVTRERLAQIQREIAAWQSALLERMMVGDDHLPPPPQFSSEEARALSTDIQRQVRAHMILATGGEEEWGTKQRTWEAIRMASGEPDRSLAIVWAAVLEERLQAALERHLPGNTTASDVITDLFDPLKYGPLSTFAAKIDMACALGIIGLGARKCLKIIARIRNDFAHKLGVRSFEHDLIRRNVEKLVYIDQALDFREAGLVKVSFRNAEGAVVVQMGHRLENNPFDTLKGRFRESCAFLHKLIDDTKPGMRMPDLFMD